MTAGRAARGWRGSGGRLAAALLSLGSLLACEVAAPPAEPPVEAPRCAPGELLDDVSPGGPACVPEECGVGPWGRLDRSAADIIYVAPWGEPLGLGTREQPLRSVQAAVERAAEADGGTILVAAGKYPEEVSVPRTRGGVRIRGRCQVMVTLDPGPEGRRTLAVGTRALLEVSGLTLHSRTSGEEFSWAVFVFARASLLAQDVAILGGRVGIEAIPFSEVAFEDSRLAGAGFYSVKASGVGRMTLLRSLIEGSSVGIRLWGGGGPVGATGELLVEDCSVRGHRGAALEVSGGAPAVVRRTDLIGNQQLGLEIVGRGDRRNAEIFVEDSRVTDTFPPSPGSYWGIAGVYEAELPVGFGGHGIEVSRWAHLVLRRTTIERAHGLALLASEGATVELYDSAILDTRENILPGSGQAIVARDGGEVYASGLVIEGSDGPGIYVLEGGRVEGSDVSLVENAFAGAVVFDGSLQLQDSEIRGSRPSGEHGGGAGVFAWAQPESKPPRVSLERVTLDDNPRGGLYLRGPGSYSVVDSTISEVRGGPYTAGVFASEGVGAWEDGAPVRGLQVAESLFEGLDGDGVLLDASSATLSGGSFSDLGGEPLYQQRCSDVEPPVVTATPDADPACRASPRPTDPKLEYHTIIVEIELEDGPGGGG